MIAYVILFIIGFGGLYFGYKNPTKGIILYLLFSPLTNFLKNLLNEIILFGLWHNVFILFLFFGYIARSLDDQKYFTWDNISLSIVVFIFWGWYQIITTFIVTGSIISAVGGFREYFFIALYILVLYQVAIRTVDLKLKIHTVLFAIFIFASFLNIFEFIYLNIFLNSPTSLIYVSNYYTDTESSSQYLNSIYREEGSNPLTGILRTFGIFLQPQLTATFIANTPFFFLSQTPKTRFKRALKVFMILLTSLSLFVSIGRTGIVSYLIFFFVIIAVSNWKSKLSFAISLIVILFSIYSFNSVLFDGLVESITLRSDEGYQNIFIHDMNEYIENNNVATFLFGNGFFPSAIEIKADVSHQNVLIATETFGLRYLHQIGFIGCLFFIGLTYFVFKYNSIKYILKYHVIEIGYLAIIFNTIFSLTHYGVFYFTGMDTYFYTSLIILITNPVTVKSKYLY